MNTGSPRRVRLLLLCALSVPLLAIAGYRLFCQLHSYSDMSVPLHSAAEGLTVERAEELGYVVLRNGDVLYGQDRFEAFADAAFHRIPGRIRIMSCSDMDPTRTEFTYYERERHALPRISVTEVACNGWHYTAETVTPEKAYPRESWRFLNHSIDAPLNKSALYTERETYFLCDDASVTYDMLLGSMVDSGSQDYIRGVLLYSRYTYKQTPEEQEREKEAPYRLPEAEYRQMETSRLAELALYDRFVIQNYFPYLDRGQDMRELVRDGIAEHPYLGELFSREDAADAMLDQVYAGQDGYVCWDQVLEKLYLAYLQK